MTKVSLDDEYLLPPREEHVPPWEDEVFSPEEAAPCQQERWERVAWPCRHGIQVFSLSPMNTPPFCVDESKPPFHEPCLPWGLPALPCCPWHCLSLSPARQGKSPASPILLSHSQWHTMLCVLFWPCCWHPGDGHPPLPWPAAVHGSSTTQLCLSSRSLLGSHGSLGSSACCPWGLGTARGAGTAPGWQRAERRSGKGVGRQGSPPPGSAVPVPLPGPTSPFITPLPFIGPDRCPQINTPRQ